MRFTTLQAVLGSASLLLISPLVDAAAGHGHRRAHDQVHAAKRHHSHRSSEIAPRKPRCTLPDDPDLVFVPGADNNGFAMSPDEPCEDGKWCPIACRPGKVMAQWKPNTTYTYPESMYGGLYCNGGKAEKPFKDMPYCVDGTGTVKAVNKAGRIVSFCQTVLPGNEAMIIPTDVTDVATLAVPGPSYWCGTAAHYYINAPGVPASRGCVWGKITEPIGNWSPYVAGANTVENGDTYVKIAWNPEFLNAPLAKTTPTYGLRIECPDGGCNGLPCSIDPSKDGVGGVNSPVSTTGVGGADFCVVTVPKGKTASIVVFNTDSVERGPAGASEKTKEGSKPTKKEESAPSPSTVVKPSPKSTSTTAPEPEATTSSARSSTVSQETTASPSATSKAFVGGLFQEQGASVQPGNSTTASNSRGSKSSTGSTQAGSEAHDRDSTTIAQPTPSNEGSAPEGGSAIAGLVVALVAAAALL